MVTRLPVESSLSPLYYLFAASQHAGRLLDTALAGAPLGPEAYALYSALRETQPTTPTALARHLGMPTTTLLDALAAMRKSAHVVEVRNPNDGRSYLVRLSEQGEDAHDATERCFTEADRRVAAHLGDRDATVTSLRELNDACEAAFDELAVLDDGSADLAG